MFTLRYLYHILPLTVPSLSANNYALKGKRKTLNAADVFAAMKDMEFEEFIEPLEKSLQGKILLSF